MTYKEILEEFTSIINVAKFVDSDYATSPLRVEVLEEAVSLYNRLNEEIGRLADRNHKCIYLSDEETTNYCVDGPCPKFKTEAQIRAEAVKEFAEELKKDISWHRTEMYMNGLKGTPRTNEITYECVEEYIDNLVKEFTEGNGGG